MVKPILYPLPLPLPPPQTHDHLAPRTRLPTEYLQGVLQHSLNPGVSESPLIVFINAKSGGHDGPNLALNLVRALGRQQVFDVNEWRPDVVLSQLWENLRQRHLRCVCGPVGGAQHRRWGPWVPQAAWPHPISTCCLCPTPLQRYLFLSPQP